MDLEKAPVVWFDAVGTLISVRHPIGECYSEVATRHGWSLNPARVQSAFGRAWRAAPKRASVGVPRPDDDREWWMALVEVVLNECGVGSDPVARAAYFIELYEEYAKAEAWSVYPEVSEVLDQLSGRFEIGVLSNFDGRLRRVLQAHGLAHYFEHWVISSEVGADKPDRAIFDHALRLCGGPPARMLHVGDDPELDWAGAERAGWRSFALDRKRNSLRDLIGWLERKSD